jgi:phage baseplate assembly protein W
MSTAISQAHAHIQESVLQILGTRIGERLMSPDFGSRLHELVFEQNDSVLKALIRHYVIEALEQWEKRITVTAVEFGESVDANHLPVSISYQIVQTQVDGNLVYPFYRELS